MRSSFNMTSNDLFIFFIIKRLSWGFSNQTDCIDLYEYQREGPDGEIMNLTKCRDTMTIHPDVIERIWIPDLFFSNEKQ